jgi:hypothetical protein
MDDLYGNPRETALLSYLAGIVDGEGYIFIAHYNTTNRYLPYVGCSMTHPTPPNMLLEQFSGSISKARLPSGKILHRWQLCGRDKVVRALEALVPYMTVKSAQANLLVEFCTGYERYKGPDGRVRHTPALEVRRREDLHKKMQELNA